MKEQQKKGGSAELWELIRGMTSGERRFFTTQHRPSPPSEQAINSDQESEKYLLLYEDLLATQVYEENEFKEKYQAQPYMASFGQHKNYLSELILQDLAIYRLKSLARLSLHTEIALTAGLEQVGILWDKGLTSYAEKWLRKVKKYAKDHEYYELLMKILRQERYMTMFQQRKGYERKIEAIHEEWEHCLKIMENQTTVLQARDEEFLQLREESGMGKMDKKERIRKKLQNPKLMDPQLAISTDAKVSQLQFQISAYLQLVDLPKAWEASHKMVQLWEQNASYARVRTKDYRSTLYNFLSISIEMKEFAQFDSHIAKMTEKPFLTEQEELEAENNQLYLRVQKAMKQGDWTEMKHWETIFQRKEKKLAGAILRSRHLSYALSFGVANLFNQNYVQASKWLDRGIHYRQEGISHNLHRLCNLFRMLVAYETGNLEDLANVFRSLTRNTETWDKYPKWEQQFLSQIATLPDQLPAQIPEVFASLLALLQSTQAAIQSPGAGWLAEWLMRHQQTHSF